MANNVRAVQRSQELRDGARGLVERSVDMAKLMITGQVREIELVRGGRKAHELDGHGAL